MRARPLVLCLLAALPAFPPRAAATGGIPLALREEAVASGGYVRLGDVAECGDPSFAELQDAFLRPCPAAGEALVVEADSIRARLAQLGASGRYEVSGGPARVRGDGADAAPAARALADAWRGPAADSLGLPSDAIAIDCRFLDPTGESPAGETLLPPPFPRNPVQGFLGGISRYVATVPWAGRDTRVEVIVRERQRVWTASRDLPAGALLTGEALAVAWRDAAPAGASPEDVVTEPDGWRDRACAVPLARGTVLRARHLAHPVWIRAGRPVRVDGVRDGIRFRGHGTAVAAARAGEPVEVVLEPSGARVRGRASGPDCVSFGEEEAR